MGEHLEFSSPQEHNIESQEKLMAVACFFRSRKCMEESGRAWNRAEESGREWTRDEEEQKRKVEVKRQEWTRVDDGKKKRARE